jgi:predicted nuclease with TOPRIM domain
VLLVLSAFTYCAGAAQTNNVSFHGFGVTVDMVYPDEAHPSETITHNVTISSDGITTLQNFTVVITAIVNQGLEVIYSGQDTLGHLLPYTYNLTIPVPLGTNGSLLCSAYVRTTGMGLDDLHFTVQTTQVRILTYSELLADYNVLAANYSALTQMYDVLNANYISLLIEHNQLTANYSDLFTNYTTLLGSYNTLLGQYNNLALAYDGVTADYATLNGTYNALSTNYNSLNSSFNSLFAQNSALQADFNGLNSTHYSLQATYNALVANRNALQTDYNSLTSAENLLQTNYNSLLGTKNALQSDFNSLNSTYNGMQNTYALLRDAYNSLNSTYTALRDEVDEFTRRINNAENALNGDRVVLFIFVAAVAVLVAFVIYIRHKKAEPYMVIRKETVAIENDKEQ